MLLIDPIFSAPKQSLLGKFVQRVTVLVIV
jgi:hypothetical protein